MKLPVACLLAVSLLACGETQTDLFCRSCVVGIPIAAQEPVVVCGFRMVCEHGEEPDHGECDEPELNVELSASGVVCEPADVPEDWAGCSACVPTSTGELTLVATMFDQDEHVLAQRRFGPMPVVRPAYELQCVKFFGDAQRSCAASGAPTDIELLLTAEFDAHPLEVTPHVESDWAALEFSSATNWARASIDATLSWPPSGVRLTVSHADWSETIDVAP